jgi:UDP-N-acetylglucosamine transferase subunit ALG13
VNPSERPFVLVTVGTDFHPFDRLVNWVDDWMARQGDEVECLVQHGSSHAPLHCTGSKFLRHDELQSAMARAAAVVTHGGPATIAEIRSAGLRPICVPRDPRRGEHVDEHQLRFARYITRTDAIVLAESAPTLEQALDTAIGTPASVHLPRQADGRHDDLPAVRRIGTLIDRLLAEHGQVRRTP